MIWKAAQIGLNILGGATCLWCGGMETGLLWFWAALWCFFMSAIAYWVWAAFEDAK